MEVKQKIIVIGVLGIAWVLNSGGTLAADWVPVRKKLISVEDNLRVQEWKYQTTTPAGFTVTIVKSVLHGGKQEGVDIVTIDNGRMTIVVIPTRGMSILGVTMGRLRLGWDSPVREVVHPAHINLHDRDGLGWLDGFNEWLVRCGLEFAGHPGTDIFRDNTGAESKRKLTLHGKIGNIPASEVEVSVGAEPPHQIRLRGRVDERSFYGAALELATEITTNPGSPTFTINDRVTNRGAESQEYEIIYHANFGTPILESGASVEIPLRRLQPMNDVAGKALETFNVITGPVPGQKENVFLIEPLSDPDGDTTILIQNADKTLGCSMHYPIHRLPYLTIWKNLALERSGYVMGVEPGTNYPFNRKVERQSGRLKMLESGETKAFELSYTLHDNPESILQVSEEIRNLNEGFTPTLINSPPSID